MRWNRPATVALAALLASIFVGQAAGAESLLGEWKLVEQTYGDGRANLLDEDAQPVRLEFFREGPEIRGRILADGDDAAPLPWPRLVPDGARTVHIEQMRFSVAEDGVLARYRVDPSPGDDLVLVVTEEYAVAEEGRALVGTVRVEFRREGEDRGSYTLHRRFVRKR